MTARHALSLCLVAALAAPAAAWEADTTHAGLTEQAAASSQLHERLRDQFGHSLGVYAPLVIPPDDAQALFQILGRLNPTHGYVPDDRGRQSAGAWLVAGAVIADMPVAAARNHFFDAFTRQGLTMPRVIPEPLASVTHRAGRRVAKDYIGGKAGTSALAWIESADNPLSLEGFRAQYRKALLARTQGERDRHLAGALLAAGATLHVLQDMASPSHVRNDIAAHMEQIGTDAADVGSRFERVAALAYGRLGVPGAEPVARASIAAFFSDEDGNGLADWTGRSFFSAGTLPRTIDVPNRVRPAELQAPLARGLRKASPAPDAASLDLIKARQRGGVTLANDAGVCLAQYAVRDHQLAWSIDDACALAQVGHLLPRASAYSAGLLDFLFRGAIAITVADGTVTASPAGADLGAGKVTFLWDDSRRVRMVLAADVAATGGTVGASLATAKGLPKDARYVAVLFEGVDAAGQPVQAAGFLDLAANK